VFTTSKTNNLRRPDAYHSCYVLAGLSSAQHHYYIKESPAYDQEDLQTGVEGVSIGQETFPMGKTEQPIEEAESTSGNLLAAFKWAASTSIPSSSGGLEEQIFDEQDRVKLVHPVFLIPWGVAEKTRSWYEARPQSGWTY
jgi:protein farnesyltransferase subunit beta